MNPSAPDGDRDPGGELRRDLWTRPEPGLTGIHDIFDYALTLDGHAYAQDVLHAELHECARDLVQKWNGPARGEMDFVELRLLLFWEQSCALHAWQPGGFVRRSHDLQARIWDASRPTEGDLRHFRELYRATCDAWEREWPVAREHVEVRRDG
jgi:hypothetical protein